MKHIHWLLAFALAIPLQAAVTVAHLQSALCGQTAAIREGSAVLFSRDGKAYALTADFLALDSRVSGRYCTTLAVGGESPTPATLLATDWGNGLALFEWKASNELPTTEALFAADAEAGDDVTFRTATADITGAAILAGPTVRHLFGEATYVSEVQGAAIHASDVGGAVLLGDKFAGLLSGQYLQMVPGTPTRVREWRNGGGPQSQLLMLHNQAIAKWVGDYFASPTTFRAHWHRYEEDQTKDPLVESVAGGGLTYTATCPPETPSGPSNGDFPIGGGNGVGSGGGDPVTRACRVEVAVNSDAPAPFPIAARGAWDAEARTALQSGPISVPLIFREDPETHALVHRTFFSLGGFFQNLAKTDWQVATILPGGETPLRLQARATRKAASQQYGDIPVDDQNLFGLIRQSYLLSTLLDSDSSARVKPADIDVLADPKGFYAFQWRILESNLTSVNYHVRDALVKLRAVLAGGAR